MYSLPVVLLSFLAATVAGRPSFNNSTAWANSTAHIEARRSVNITLSTSRIEARSLNSTSALNATAHIVVRRSLNATEAVNSTSHVVVRRSLNPTTGLNKTADVDARRSLNATEAANSTSHSIPRSLNSTLERRSWNSSARANSSLS